MAVSEISTGDHSEGADGRERARLRATKGAFAITIANEFALETTWQIQVTRENFTWIVVALALGPARIIARVWAVMFRLARVARAATELPRVVIAAVTIARLRLPQVVIVIEIVRAALAAAERFVVARIVVSRIEVHIYSSSRIES